MAMLEYPRSKMVAVLLSISAGLVLGACDSESPTPAQPGVQLAPNMGQVTPGTTLTPGGTGMMALPTTGNMSGTGAQTTPEGTGQAPDTGDMANMGGDMPDVTNPGGTDDMGGTMDTGGTAGMGGDMGGDAGTGGDEPVVMGPIPSRCSSNGNDVAIIGDSYIALSNAIPRLLEMYSGQKYRNYAVSGTVISQIRSQAQTAYRTPTKTLIMTGGGNDALLNTACLFAGFTGSCKTSVDQAIGVVPMLLDEAEEAGVEEIIFFYYPHITGSTNPKAMNEIDDYALPKVQEHCESRTGLDCTFIDTRDDFGENSPYFIFDGIHPNQMGSEIIADLVWEVMEDNCANGLDLQ